MAEYAYNTTMITTYCGACGESFAIMNKLESVLRTTGEWFWCPRGHKIHYTVGKTEEQKTIERLREHIKDQENELVKYWEVENKKREQERRERFLKRSKECSVCHKRFIDLVRHHRRVHGKAVTAA